MTDAVVSPGNRKTGLSSFALKLIAIITMLIDHTSAVFMRCGYTVQGFTVMGLPVWRLIGRFAFPLFAFMIAEGADRTKNISRYLKRLFVFALISEIPFDITLKLQSPKQILEFSGQNVYFTLFFGLLTVSFYKMLQKHDLTGLSVLTTALCAAAAFFLRTDYSWSGVLCIFLMYLFKDKTPAVRVPGFAAAVAVLSLAEFDLNVFELFALCGLLPILLYNGEKGRNVNRYVFYAFYPAHLLILRLLIFLLFRV